LPLIHKLDEFSKDLYLLLRQIPKRDRFGIFLKIEGVFWEILELVVSAALESKTNKLPLLSKARIKVEVLKRLFRATYELNIIRDEKFLKFQSTLQEISKMINGWINYLKNK